MGTFTASILVGSGHPNDGGISPITTLYLNEGSKISWVMRGARGSRQEVTWICSVDHTLEDAILMMAYFVLSGIHGQPTKATLFKLLRTRTLSEVDCFSLQGKPYFLSVTSVTCADEGRPRDLLASVFPSLQSVDQQGCRRGIDFRR